MPVVAVIISATVATKSLYLISKTSLPTSLRCAEGRGFYTPALASASCPTIWAGTLYSPLLTYRTRTRPG